MKLDAASKLAKDSGGGNTGAAVPALAQAATSTSVRDLSDENPNVYSSINGTSTANASYAVQGQTSSDITFSESAYQDFQSQVTFKESLSTL